MPRLLSAALTVEKNRLESDHVWTMLIEVLIPGAPVPYRLANADQDVTFHGFTFLRYPFDVDSMEDATSMALVRLRLSIGNVDQALLSLLEHYWGPDTPWLATLWYPVDLSQPNETPFLTGDLFEVVQVSTDGLAAVVDVQAEGLTLTGTMPGRRYSATAGFPFIPRRVG